MQSFSLTNSSDEVSNTAWFMELSLVEAALSID